jgi:hypothetical protein
VILCQRRENHFDGLHASIGGIESVIKASEKKYHEVRDLKVAAEKTDEEKREASSQHP